MSEIEKQKKEIKQLKEQVEDLIFDLKSAQAYIVELKLLNKGSDNYILELESEIAKFKKSNKEKKAK